MMSSLKLTEADYLAAQRELYSRSMASYAQRFWSVLEPARPYIHNWHIDAICEHLEACAKGDIRKIYIAMPPGTMKSLTVSVFFPSWLWTFAPARRVLAASHAERLAIRDNLRCRRLILSDQYQKLWGETVKLSSEQNTKTKFENTATGFRESMPFTSMTGSRGDYLVLDDPLSVDDANSEAVREQVATTFLEAVPTRLNDERTSCIIVMQQRLHQRDVIGIAEANNLGYEKLVLPMEYEPGPRYVTSLGWSDPRKEEGELLFPERFSREHLDTLRKSLGTYGWASQMQQSPVPREGAMFDRENFGWTRTFDPATKFVRGWDLAASTGQNAAFTAGVKIGKMPNGRYLVAHAIRRRLTPRGVEDLLVSTAKKDTKKTRISGPQDPGQAGKQQAQYLVSKLAGYRVSFTPESGDKVTRAEPFASQVEAGNVDILRTGIEELDSWIEPYLDEVCNFPSGRYMDQTDASSRAFNELITGSNYNIGALA